MAVDVTNLHLRAGAPGDCFYTYDAGSDTLATVLTAGYFNNTDDALNLAAEDLIFIQATDGNCWARVSAVSSGSVTLQYAGGDLPVQTMGSGTAGAKTLTAMGHYEVGSAISTASRVVLPTPYAGAHIAIWRVGSGSGAVVQHYDAGTGTGVTFTPSGERRIRLARPGEGFHLQGVSTTRWRIVSMKYNSTGASASAGGGASAFLFAGT